MMKDAADSRPAISTLLSGEKCHATPHFIFGHERLAYRPANTRAIFAEEAEYGRRTTALCKNGRFYRHTSARATRPLRCRRHDTRARALRRCRQYYECQVTSA